MRRTLCCVAAATLLAGYVSAEEPVAEPVSDAETGVDRPAFTPYAYSGSAFVEQFLDLDDSRWSPSRAQKATPVGGETFSYVGKWEVQEPTVFPGLVGDKGLVVTSQAAHHAISASLDTPLDPAKDDVVVQYEVKLQKGLECGGAYIKLLSESEQGVQAQEFSDKTEYSIMFGPDKCGSTNKVHLILRHKSPKTGVVEEKHLKAPPSPRISKTTALYTLHLSPSDSSYEIFINGESAKKGSLLSDDFSPKFTPEEEIDDENDKKPEDWVDAAKITDPDATKPDDWDEDAPMEIPDEDATMPEGWLEDEPATVPDPEAEKPEEWDDEEDGDWVAPSVPNPKCEDAPGCGPWSRPMKANPEYKGKWYAPLIDNPLYKGVWKAARILNPAYYEEKAPLSNIGRIAAVGFEIWSMQNDILFDNIYIGSSIKEAQAFAKATYHVKKPIEDAEEKRTMPKDTHNHHEAADAVSFKSDPIGFARSKLLGFIDLAREDPVFAVKSQPQTAAVVGGGLLTLLGMISAVLGLLAPKPAVVKKKASEGAAAAKSKINATANAAADSPAGVQTKEAAANVKAATTSAVEDVNAAVKKRTGKGKATDL